MSGIHQEASIPGWGPGRGDTLGSGSWPGPGPGRPPAPPAEPSGPGRSPGTKQIAVWPAARHAAPGSQPRRANSATRGDGGGRLGDSDRPARVQPAHSQSGSCGSCLGSSSSGGEVAEAEAEVSPQQPMQPAHRLLPTEGEGEVQQHSGSGESDVKLARPCVPHGKVCPGKYPSQYQQYYPGYLPGGGGAPARPPNPASQAGGLRWAEGEGEFDLPLVPAVLPGPAQASRVRSKVSANHRSPARACSRTTPGGKPAAAPFPRLLSRDRNSDVSAIRGKISSPKDRPLHTKTPINSLSEDLLVGIFQRLSASEWRVVVPQVCKRWSNTVKTCNDIWTQVEVCPFENSEVSRRLVPNIEERYWPVDARGMRWLANSSLSKERVLKSLIPQAGNIRALLLSCLTLTLAPEANDNQDDDTRQPRWIRASDFETADLVQLVREARHSLRHFMIRVSGEITKPEVLAEVCRAQNLELLHAELGNIELDCAMMAPLKHLTSLRLRRDELSLDMNEGGMKLINLDRLSECTELTRLSLGFDTHLEQLPQQIFNLGKLTSLEVDRCSNMGRLPACISKLTSLETLSLSGSSSLPALPAEMESLAKLVSLNLDFCTKMSALPTEIGSLINLRRLSMEGGYAIFDDGVPYEIGLCSNLQSLVLADTHILSLPRLADKLASCSSLQVLSLDHNDDLQIESYPHQIMALPKLMMLSMRKYERQSWSVISTRNIARMQEEATQLRLQQGRLLQIIL